MLPEPRHFVLVPSIFLSVSDLSDEFNTVSITHARISSLMCKGFASKSTKKKKENRFRESHGTEIVHLA